MGEKRENIHVDRIRAMDNCEPLLRTVHTRWRDIIAARSAYRYNEYIGKTNCLCKPALKRKLLLVIAYFKSN